MGQYLPMIVFTAMVVGAIGLVVLLALAGAALVKYLRS